MKRIATLTLLFTLLFATCFQSPNAFAALTTEAPTTELPTTEVPTTELATTEAPTSEVPTTEASTAETTTEAPTTEAPTTEAPTTEAPTTEAPTTEAVNPNEVKILHTNDIHGRLDAEDGRVIGMAKLKTIKDTEQPTFMFDSGDAFQGLPLSNFSKGADMAKAMNAVGYDAMTVGNHEFDFGFETAMNYKQLLNFPIISSNVYKDGKTVFVPSTIIEKNGKKFGVIGVTTPETATKTHPNNIIGVTFMDPLTSVTNEMKKLQGQVDAFIILSHLGIDTTTKEAWRGDYLASQLATNQDFRNNAIIILDGHSHSVIENGELKNTVLLAQTGTALANIGKITFNLQDQVATDFNATMIKEADTKEVLQDTAVKAIVDTAKENFGKATSEVVFYNPVQLMGERADVRTRETNLGNAIADAMETYSETGFDSVGDFAVTNGGGIRASIDGNKDVTVGDIIKVLPFGNTITQIDVLGSDVKAMFEHALSAPTVEQNGTIGLDANGAFLHISKSIRVHYDLTKPAGERVYAIEVLNKATGEFEPLDMNKTYKVVTNDFLAVGGDGYTMLGGPREEGPSLDTVVRNYFKSADMTAYQSTELQRILAGTANENVPGEVTTETPTTEVPTVEATTETPTTEAPTDEATMEEDTIESVTTEQPTSMQDTPAAFLEVKHDNVIPFDQAVKQKDKSQHDAKAQTDKETAHQLPITGEAAGTGAAAIGLFGLGLYLIKRKSA
ncbi:5'-nucleotidase C-terminal domain-containing protein [Macrococcoides caseolyticum]|uniref:5'-nucleotidase C-terminal domain-containing protein n=1 Tax=Macrococcoides caseolyticum TaxID=69966 RepID=UPI001F29DA5E|nr:5'-nucleotidase C-terminal domain-containing protein [Macrococcus caseolyticus]MCE4957979.1 5'-nucleotidase C-terminal domain-containing protein [Macrococcus caseolyticus]